MLVSARCTSSIHWAIEASYNGLGERYRRRARVFAPGGKSSLSPMVPVISSPDQKAYARNGDDMLANLSGPLGSVA